MKSVWCLLVVGLALYYLNRTNALKVEKKADVCKIPYMEVVKLEENNCVEGDYTDKCGNMRCLKVRRFIKPKRNF